MIAYWLTPLLLTIYYLVVRCLRDAEGARVREVAPVGDEEGLAVQDAFLPMADGQRTSRARSEWSEGGSEDPDEHPSLYAVVFYD